MTIYRIKETGYYEIERELSADTEEDASNRFIEDLDLLPRFLQLSCEDFQVIDLDEAKDGE